MSSPFEVIGIYGRVKNPGVVETLYTLIKYLKKLNKSCLIETNTAQQLDGISMEVVAREILCQRCDLVIVVGGDGSLLQAAPCLVDGETPVIGVNRGRLGFLTDIHPSQLHKIKDIFDGHYVLEKRFVLSATVEHDGKTIGISDALNEVALIPDSVPHMIEFEVYIDDKFVLSQHSDGLIIATPTGSTAYALSGGGPILHPQLDAIVMVPMFPHTLSIRPIVLQGHQEIKIVITPNNTHTPRITCDAKPVIQAPPLSQITIVKKSKHLHLIHPSDYDYYETLRSKLHWGHKLQYNES